MVNDKLLAIIMLRLAHRLMSLYLHYQATGELAITQGEEEILRIYSRQPAILKLYDTDIEEIDKQLGQHKVEDNK